MPPPRKTRQPAPPHLAMPVEVMDAAGRTLLVMPLHRAMRQHLPCRSVLVCLRNLRGEIFLHKRPSLLPEHESLWHLAASAIVPAGSSRYDAASEALERHLGITGLKLVDIAAIEPCPATRNTAATLYLARVVSTLPPVQNPHEGLFVTRKKLDALLREKPHLAAPYLPLLAGRIFSQEGGAAAP